MLHLLRHDPWNFIRANAMLSLYPIVASTKQARHLFFSEGVPDADVAEYQSNLKDEAYLAFLDMIFNRPHPKRVGVKPLVLGAELDTIFSPAAERAVAAAYGTEAIIFENTAHDMMLEPSWQTVADGILSWLDQRENRQGDQ
jgi:hypothetical protein